MTSFQQDPKAPQVDCQLNRQQSRSFSKDYVMTGWRIGYAIAPPQVIRTVKDVNENAVFTAPSISQRAALHALRRRHEIQPAIKATYEGRMARACERVCSTPGLSAVRPRGSIYLWVDITSTGLSSTTVADRIFEEAHVSPSLGRPSGRAATATCGSR